MLNEIIRNGESDSLRDGKRIIPYVCIDGAMTVPDTSVKWCYDQMVKEGLLKTVFPEGIGRDEFVAFTKSPAVLPQFIYDDKTIAGFTWLSEIGRNSAVGNFCFFKSHWGYGIPEEIGRDVLDYWFSFPGKDGPLFDVIVGKTPEWNRRAVKYIERLGFNILGTIPYLSRGRGMIISYKTRQEWAENQAAVDQPLLKTPTRTN